MNLRPAEYAYTAPLFNRLTAHGRPDAIGAAYGFRHLLEQYQDALGAREDFRALAQEVGAFGGRQKGN